jgi:tagatose-1,6-bisphosphate aldolase non-catalytic subunit AgaZ/GatZ
LLNDYGQDMALYYYETENANAAKQACIAYVKRLQARQIPPAMIARWLEVRREFDAQGAIQYGKVWTAIDDIWEMFDAYMLANVYRKDDEG